MKKKWIYIIAAVVLVVAAVTAVTVYYYNTNSYVASVDGEKITKSEYLFFLGAVKEQMLSEANVSSTDASKFWATNIEGKSAQEVAKDKALENAKEMKIQLIKAKENKIALDSSEINDINSRVASMISQLGGKDAANQRIQSEYGISVDDYTNIYKEYMLVSKYSEAEQKKIEPTDEDLREYYDQNLEKAGEKTTVWHILLSIKDQDGNLLSDDKQLEIKKKADDILKKVKDGEDFASLAKQYSEDPGSKDTGGQYTFGKGEMVEEFESWSFAAKPGDTGIIKSDFGYHVMKKPTFNELKDTAKSGAVQDAYYKMLEDWKKDPKYDVVKNQKVLNLIKVA